MTSASASDEPYFAAGPASGIELLDAPAAPTVVARAEGLPMSRIRELFDSTFSALFPALAERGIRPVGPAFSLYRRMPSETVDVEVGIPVASALDAEIRTASGVVLVPSALPAGRVARATHLGSYDGLADAWGSLMTGLADKGVAPGLPFWEIYVTEPTPDATPADMRTDLYILVGD